MIKLAVVEDDISDQNILKEYMERFEKENQENENITIDFFSDGMQFVTDYRPIYSLVFLDICMPLLDGMETAKRIREKDEHIGIVFLTNMVNYAIKGYEVNAMGFLAKPITYRDFSKQLKRAIKIYNAEARQKFCYFKSDDGNSIVRCSVNKIFYVEKDRNEIVYHTEMGVFRMRQYLKDVEDFFSQSHFAKCDRGCIVNILAIEKFGLKEIVVKGSTLPISRGVSKQFRERVFSILRKI